jgi:hypothetical protein
MLTLKIDGIKLKASFRKLELDTARNHMGGKYWTRELGEIKKE